MIYIPSKHSSYHGTMIPIGITYNKISCYMPSLAWGCLIVEHTKIFQDYVKHF